MKPADLLSTAKFGIPSMSLQNSESTDQTAAATSRNDTQSSGFRSSIFNNYALGGSSLDANASASASSIPTWGWVALGVGFLAWAYFRYGRNG